MENNTNNEGGENECVIPGYSSINEFSQQTLKAVLQATKSSNDLPIGSDYEFYSTFRSVRDVMDLEGQRILSLLQRLLRHQNVKGNLGPSSSLELEDRFDVLIDTNDQMLERAGTLLDEASGVKKQEAKLVLASAQRPKVSTSWNKKTLTPTNTKKAAASYHLLTARNIQRPQVRFKDKIDNSNCPFKPILREKPNALKSLEDSLKLPESVSMEESERPEFVHPHPYAFELEAFTPDSQSLVKVKPKEPQPTSLTPLIHVDTADKLQSLLEDLRGHTELAVDLEHHSYRSFQGLTCLMQISTRTHDYIVDTLDLRNELYRLNEVFTDPKITKVFHGADSDINWLQRDLGLYVVNMFDTSQAARVLNLPRFSLAHLLMQYCHVEADKQFQLADWRIRPLPDALIQYAREDTHYLLYIYDTMRNQLLDSGNSQANLLQSVYSRSKLIASQVYRKPTFHASNHLDLYKRSRKMFNSQQLAALRDLYKWRDQMARLEDESFGYVLPNHMLLQIAEILPREHQGVLACCNPIPPLVRQNLPELHKMVLQAREIAISKVEKMAAAKPSVSQHPKYDADSLLHCCHDMTRQAESVAGIETDIAATGLIADAPSMLRPDGVQLTKTPIISAFAPPIMSQTSRISMVVEKIQSLFPNPFTKFLVKDGNDNIVKPVGSEMWTLKDSTSSTKRKPTGTADGDTVDLDSFEPEYAPPQKRAKVTINLSQSSAGSKAKGQTIFGLPDPGRMEAEAAKAKKNEIKDKISSKLQNLRQEVLKAKKRLKEVEADRKGAKNNSTNQTQKESPSQDIIAPSDDGDKRKKKKKQKQDDRTEDFEGFDYEAAEKQIKKEAMKSQKMDVYDPLLPSRDKKKSKDKKGGPGGKFKSKAKGSKAAVNSVNDI